MVSSFSRDHIRDMTPIFMEHAYEVRTTASALTRPCCSRPAAPY